MWKLAELYCQNRREKYHIVVWRNIGILHQLDHNIVNGTQFIERKCMNFCKERSIKMKFTTPCSLWSNQQDEPINKTIVEILENLIEKRKWSNVVYDFPRILYMEISNNQQQQNTIFIILQDEGNINRNKIHQVGDFSQRKTIFSDRKKTKKHASKMCAIRRASSMI